MSESKVSREELELLAKGDPAADWDKGAHMLLARYTLALQEKADSFEKAYLEKIGAVAEVVAREERLREALEKAEYSYSDKVLAPPEMRFCPDCKSEPQFSHTPGCVIGNALALPKDGTALREIRIKDWDAGYMHAHGNAKRYDCGGAVGLPIKGNPHRPQPTTKTEVREAKKSND